jgi:hypothetical protein
MGAPGTRPVEGRAGAARGGMGAPGTDDVPTAGGGGPGATKCVGGCGAFGCGGGAGIDGDGETSAVGSAGVDVGGTEGGRTEREGCSGVRCRVSPGRGCRGPLGRTPPDGMGRGAGRAGTESGRFVGPAAV